jgi:hypothetical protein
MTTSAGPTPESPAFPANMPTSPGVWSVCCGIWIFVPDAATDADIWRACRQLEAFQLARESDLSTAQL